MFITMDWHCLEELINKTTSIPSLKIMHQEMDSEEVKLKERYTEVEKLVTKYQEELSNIEREVNACCIRPQNMVCERIAELVLNDEA